MEIFSFLPLSFLFLFFFFLLFFGRKDVVFVRPIDSYCAQNWGTVGLLTAYECLLPMPERNCQTPTESFAVKRDGGYRTVLAFVLGKIASG